ncbi:hypothetical protein QD47_00205 [Paenibacillus terrae]|uniref:Uncharacterized protein n=1 Tax=Paenibacillus terrae TaxID=159743 RepID=A0A0D7X8G0_9BACL|nr:hypothetical protein QD47_00205 [Paenibacillus terrae]
MIKKNVLHFIILVISGSFAVLFYFQNLIFLSLLFFLGVITDLINLFLKSKEFNDDIFKAGYFSYLVSIAYIFIVFVMYMFDILSADTSIPTILFGVILLQPIISLFLFFKK